MTIEHADDLAKEVGVVTWQIVAIAAFVAADFIIWVTM
jgi:hypothetical protein